MSLPIRLRAMVLVRGSTVQYLYGTGQSSLIRRAIKALTRYRPGCGNLHPDRIELQEQTGVISGNCASWATFKIVRYGEVASKDREWCKQEAKIQEQCQKGKR